MVAKIQFYGRLRYKTGAYILCSDFNGVELFGATPHNDNLEVWAYPKSPCPDLDDPEDYFITDARYVATRTIEIDEASKLGRSLLRFWDHVTSPDARKRFSDEHPWYGDRGQYRNSNYDLVQDWSRHINARVWLNAVPDIRSIDSELRDFFLGTRRKLLADFYLSVRFLEMRESPDMKSVEIDDWPNEGWSLDGHRWFAWPEEQAPVDEQSLQDDQYIGKNDMSLVRESLEAGDQLGVLSSLLEEINRMRYTGSSIVAVLGATAVEVAIKQYLGKSTLQVKLENRNDFPTSILYVNIWLPNLMYKASGVMVEQPIPPMLESAISRLQKERNMIVHQGSIGVEDVWDWSEKIERSVSDFVWLMRLYSGNSRALSHLSPNARRYVGKKPMEAFLQGLRSKSG